MREPAQQPVTSAAGDGDHGKRLTNRRGCTGGCDSGHWKDNLHHLPPRPQPSQSDREQL